MQNAVLVVWNCWSAPSVRSYHSISLLLHSRGSSMRDTDYRDRIVTYCTHVVSCTGRFIALIINGALLLCRDWSWIRVWNMVIRMLVGIAVFVICQEASIDSKTLFPCWVHIHCMLSIYTATANPPHKTFISLQCYALKRTDASVNDHYFVEVVICVGVFYCLQMMIWWSRALVLDNRIKAGGGGSPAN